MTARVWDQIVQHGVHVRLFARFLPCLTRFDIFDIFDIFYVFDVYWNFLNYWYLTFTLIMYKLNVDDCLVWDRSVQLAAHVRLFVWFSHFFWFWHFWHVLTWNEGVRHWLTDAGFTVLVLTLCHLFYIFSFFQNFWHFDIFRVTAGVEWWVYVGWPKTIISWLMPDSQCSPFYHPVNRDARSSLKWKVNAWSC